MTPEGVVAGGEEEAVTPEGVVASGEGEAGG